MTTWKELRGLWDERDHRYTLRRRAGVPLQMTPEEATAVRVNRRAEAERLAGLDQTKAILALNRWYPPPARL